MFLHNLYCLGCNSICNIGYITVKIIDDYENIYSVNPLYLLVNHASGYIEKKKNETKYLIFDSEKILRCLEWN